MKGADIRSNHQVSHQKTGRWGSFRAERVTGPSEKNVKNALARAWRGQSRAAGAHGSGEDADDTEEWDCEG